MHAPSPCPLPLRGRGMWRGPLCEREDSTPPHPALSPSGGEGWQIMLALRLEGVPKHFGGLCAVDGVALEVQPGERRALIGPNGAGKTTLFNLIAGALPVSSGRITLFGRDVTGASAHRRAAQGLARTFQITNLFPDLTVLENALLAIQAHTSSRFAMLWPAA